MASPRTRRVLQELRTDNENVRCFECGSHNPQWASVSLAIWICLECSGKHRSLGVHLSFVRSLTMDKWKDTELAKMKVGGNKHAREFLESQDDWDESRHISVRYNCRAAALLRDKIATEAQGKVWSVSTASCGGGGSGVSSPTSGNTSSMHKSASTSLLTSGRSADRVNSRCGATYTGSHHSADYTNSSGGYQQDEGGYQRGFTSSKEAFFGRKQAENAAKPDYLPPSQGGRYSGFGNTVNPPPQSSSSEMMDSAMQALTNGWSLLSVGASRMARSATDTALSASERLTEVSHTVSDKMREGKLGDELLTQAHQVAGKVQNWVGMAVSSVPLSNRLQYESPSEQQQQSYRESSYTFNNNVSSSGGGGNAGGYQTGGSDERLSLLSTPSGGRSTNYQQSGDSWNDGQWGSGAAWENSELAAPLTKAAKQRQTTTKTVKSTTAGGATNANDVSLIDLAGSSTTASSSKGKDNWTNWEDEAWESLSRK